jgi:porin
MNKNLNNLPSDLLEGTPMPCTARAPRLSSKARSGIRNGLSLLLSLSALSTAVAQTPTGAPAASEADAQAAPAPLFGDMGGLRPWLGHYGVTLSVQETSEYLRNLSGGVSREGAYDGLTQANLQVDTSKAFGLPGGRSTSPACKFMAAT